MNSVKLQDTKLTYKNQWCFYTLKMNYVKKKCSSKITIAPKTIKYLEINFIKEVKNLYYENYKTLMKEIKGDTKK